MLIFLKRPEVINVFGVTGFMIILLLSVCDYDGYCVDCGKERSESRVLCTTVKSGTNIGAGTRGTSVSGRQISR